MKAASAADTRALERRLAVLLNAGTWVASAVIAVGMALPSGARVVAVGIAMLVGLPVLRVVLMLVEFLWRRDYRISLIAALVLIVIALGIAVGGLV